MGAGLFTSAGPERSGIGLRARAATGTRFGRAGGHSR